MADEAENVKEVDICALRPFNKTPQGDICEPGEVFPVREVRAQELEGLGLARPATAKDRAEWADAKLAPTAENKMAPAAATKVRPPRIPERPAEMPRAIVSTDARPSKPAKQTAEQG